MKSYFLNLVAPHSFFPCYKQRNFKIRTMCIVIGNGNEWGVTIRQSQTKVAFPCISKTKNHFFNQISRILNPTFLRIIFFITAPFKTFNTQSPLEELEYSLFSRNCYPATTSCDNHFSLINFHTEQNSLACMSWFLQQLNILKLIILTLRVFHLTLHRPQNFKGTVPLSPLLL